MRVLILDRNGLILAYPFSPALPYFSKPSDISEIRRCPNNFALNDDALFGFFVFLKFICNRLVVIFAGFLIVNRGAGDIRGVFQLDKTGFTVQAKKAIKPSIEPLNHANAPYAVNFGDDSG